MTIGDAIKQAVVDPCIDKDGKPDVVRVGIALAVASYIALSAYAVIRSGAFDMVSFGTGFGLLLAGGGGGSWMHSNSNK